MQYKDVHDSVAYKRIQLVCVAGRASMVRAFVDGGVAGHAHEPLQVFLKFRVSLHCSFMLFQTLIIQVGVLLSTLILRQGFRNIKRPSSFCRGFHAHEVSSVPLKSTSLTFSLNSRLSEERCFRLLVRSRILVNSWAAVSLMVSHDLELSFVLASRAVEVIGSLLIY